MPQEDNDFNSVKDASKKLGKAIPKVNKAMNRFALKKGRKPTLEELGAEVEEAESETAWPF